MKKTHILILLSALSLGVIPSSKLNAQLFGSGDIALAIDADVNSNYPGAEGPANAADQMSTTKYLNFGRAGTGFIITPAGGASMVQGLRLTTANDAPERDPMTYDLYGTNDPIISGDNSNGDQENWSLISSGSAGLDVDPGREMPGQIVDFANANSFNSYKVIFPALRDNGLANSMQVADVSLFTEPAGGGSQILMSGDAALAVTDSSDSQSNYPDPEGPTNVFDGTLSKYLNFGKDNSGVIVARADGLSTIVQDFVLTTADDAPERDPSAWELYGTNDPLMSGDNSLGNLEDWTLVDLGSVDLPVDRGVDGDLISVSNTTAYSAYRMVFSDLRDAGAANSMQIAEITFGGTVVPEPSMFAGLLFGALALLHAGRRNR